MNAWLLRLGLEVVTSPAMDGGKDDGAEGLDARAVKEKCSRGWELRCMRGIERATMRGQSFEVFIVCVHVPWRELPDASFSDARGDEDARRVGRGAGDRSYYWIYETCSRFPRCHWPLKPGRPRTCLLRCARVFGGFCILSNGASRETMFLVKGLIR